MVLRKVSVLQRIITYIYFTLCVLLAKLGLNYSMNRSTYKTILEQKVIKVKSWARTYNIILSMKSKL